jgi:hypothetical protein
VCERIPNVQVFFDKAFGSTDMANTFDIREKTKWWQGLDERVDHVWTLPVSMHPTFQGKQEHAKPWRADKGTLENQKSCAWLNDSGFTLCVWMG